jgi:hypothetical protein
MFLRICKCKQKEIAYNPFLYVFMLTFPMFFKNWKYESKIKFDSYDYWMQMKCILDSITFFPNTTFWQASTCAKTENLHAKYPIDGFKVFIDTPSIHQIKIK